MSDALELKPCPFCGCPASSQKTITDAAVWCIGCGAKVVRLHHVGATFDWDATPRAVSSWNRRADLDAAKDARITDLTRQLAEAREVKPLAWREYPDKGFWRADTVIGEYSVGFDDGWWAQLEGVEFWEWNPPDDPRSYSGPATGMNACKADYEARILSALKGAKP